MPARCECEARLVHERSVHVSEGMALLTIFVLAAFVGFEVISKVSTTLHTPLMSGANAIHGVILVGAILVAGEADSTGQLVVALLAVVLATLNMVGGFVVTDRMLEMFGRGAPPQGPRHSGSRRTATRERQRERLRLPRIRGLFHPGAEGAVVTRTARYGNLVGAAGAVLAVIVRLYDRGPRPHPRDPRCGSRGHGGRSGGGTSSPDDRDAAARCDLQWRRRRGGCVGGPARAGQHRRRPPYGSCGLFD